MKTILKDLWSSYLIESTAILDDEEKVLLDKIVLKEKELNEKLTKEQLALLENFTDSFHEMNCISERNAFIKGVCFATKYLFEVLSTNLLQY